MICSRSSAQQRCEADQPGVNGAAWRRANSAAEIGARPTNCWKESVMRSYTDCYTGRSVGFTARSSDGVSGTCK